MQLVPPMKYGLPFTLTRCLCKLSLHLVPLALGPFLIFLQHGSFRVVDLRLLCLSLRGRIADRLDSSSSRRPDRDWDFPSIVPSSVTEARIPCQVIPSQAPISTPSSLSLIRDSFRRVANHQKKSFPGGLSLLFLGLQL